MAEKRTEVIRHRVWNDVTKKEEIVDKTFIYNESPDGSIKYITHQWCIDRAKEADYAFNPTFHTIFRDRKETYEYENPNGETTQILEMKGKFIDEHTYVYTFIDINENEFIVPISL